MACCQYYGIANNDKRGVSNCWAAAAAQGGGACRISTMNDVAVARPPTSAIMPLRAALTELAKACLRAYSPEINPKMYHHQQRGRLDPVTLGLA